MAEQCLNLKEIFRLSAFIYGKIDPSNSYHFALTGSLRISKVALLKKHEKKFLRPRNIVSRNFRSWLRMSFHLSSTIFFPLKKEKFVCSVMATNALAMTSSSSTSLELITKVHLSLTIISLFLLLPIFCSSPKKSRDQSNSSISMLSIQIIFDYWKLCNS